MGLAGSAEYHFQNFTQGLASFEESSVSNHERRKDQHRDADGAGVGRKSERSSGAGNYTNSQ
jgi:hypothetical protein